MSTAIIISAAAALVLLCVGLYCPLTVRRYTVKTSKRGEPFKLALLSDLHSSRFGDRQQKLAALIEGCSPDAVVYTGDIYDGRRDFTPCGELFAALKKYPSFYISGNHEMNSPEAEEVFSRIEAAGVRVLRDELVSVRIKGRRINIAGLSDPVRLPDYSGYLRDIAALGGESDAFKLLLAHRPEFFDEYVKYGYDLILCGHAHGGQWRLPFLINGLYAPHQGIFPRHAGGLYEKNKHTMIVSRGLSRLNPLPRIFNPHEVVIIEIASEEIRN